MCVLSSVQIVTLGWNFSRRCWWCWRRPYWHGAPVSTLDHRVPGPALDQCQLTSHMAGSCSLHTWRSRVHCTHDGRVFTAHMTVACSLHTWRSRVHCTHDGHVFTSHMTDACSVQWRCCLRWATSHLQCWDLPMMLTKDEDIYLYIDQRWRHWQRWRHLPLHWPKMKTRTIYE